MISQTMYGIHPVSIVGRNIFRTPGQFLFLGTFTNSLWLYLGSLSLCLTTYSQIIRTGALELWKNFAYLIYYKDFFFIFFSSCCLCPHRMQWNSLMTTPSHTCTNTHTHTHTHTPFHTHAPVHTCFSCCYMCPPTHISHAHVPHILPYFLMFFLK